MDFPKFFISRDAMTAPDRLPWAVNETLETPPGQCGITTHVVARFGSHQHALTFLEFLQKKDLTMHEPILQFFEYEHLPPHLQEVSKPFCELARAMAHPETGLPRNPERTVALRKLLESKDAAVRAKLFDEKRADPPENYAPGYSFRG
jgi:hypothetical protein